MENTSLQKSSNSKRIKTKNILIFLVLIVLAISITILIIFIEIQLKDKVQNAEVPTTQVLDPRDNGQRFWFIDRIEPTDNTYQIQLSSNAGNLRSYDNLVSFGLSQNREMLAVNTGSEIKVIKLIDESSVSIQIPSQKFAGSIGDSITWDKDNKHFAMGVYTDDSVKNARIWIFSIEGNLTKEITANLAYDSSNKNKIEPVIFGSTENNILARTFKTTDQEDLKDDGTNYKILELPIYLIVFDMNGNVVKEIMVNDFSTDNTKVYYKWDNKNVSTISYYLYKSGTNFDPLQDYLFTKVRI